MALKQPVDAGLYLKHMSSIRKTIALRRRMGRH